MFSNNLENHDMRNTQRNILVYTSIFIQNPPVAQVRCLEYPALNAEVKLVKPQRRIVSPRRQTKKWWWRTMGPLFGRLLFEPWAYNIFSPRHWKPAPCCQRCWVFCKLLQHGRFLDVRNFKADQR